MKGENLGNSLAFPMINDRGGPGGRLSSLALPHRHTTKRMRIGMTDTSNVIDMRDASSSLIIVQPRGLSMPIYATRLVY